MYRLKGKLLNIFYIQNEWYFMDWPGFSTTRVIYLKRNIADGP